MDFKRVVVWAAAVAGLVGAWLVAGPGHSVEAQETTTSVEWELVTSDVAGYGAGGQSISSAGAAYGRVFLYNKATGKTYRFWPACSDDGFPNGCFASLPMIDDASSSGRQLPVPFGDREKLPVR